MVTKQNIQLSNTYTVWLHMALWLLVLHLAFDLIGLCESFVITFLEDENLFDVAFIEIPILIGLFYWNSHFLIPKYLNRTTWWKYLLGLTMSFLLLLFIGYSLVSYLWDSGFILNIEDKIEFFDLSLISSLTVIGISTSLGITKIAMENDRQKQEAEEKQKQAELKYLTNQFNPHFLFNTLNGIYSLSTEEQATKTTEAILKLSEIMRYPIKEGAKQKIPLKKEIEFIEDYIDLKKMRIGEDYPITFLQNGELDNVEVAPLLFIPIIENAFKYGISQKELTPIWFSLSVQKGWLYFKCENEINNYHKHHSHQTGIQNLRLRLKLLYGQNQSLTNETKGNKYMVDLQIKL